MRKIKNTMELVEKSIGCINNNYDIVTNNIEDIQKASGTLYDLVYYGFRFGYMQGMKAAKAEMKRGGVVNG